LTDPTRKGGKARHLPFFRDMNKALYPYLNEREYEPDEPLFLSDRGNSAGEALTPIDCHGLRFLIGRAGRLGVGRTVGEDVTLPLRQSRGTDLAESISEIALRVRVEVNGPRGRE
jgi:hypothetical protein